MSRTARDAAAPVGLILIGLVLLIYGAGYHSTGVLTQQEVKATAESGPPRSPFPEPGAPPPPPFFDDQPPPPPPPPTQSAPVIVEKSEPSLIREVTIGGVVRLASGELKQTYSGAPPSLCPT